MATRERKGATRERKGAVALAIGFVLAIIGFAVILYEIWSTATIPLNNITYVGVAVAGVGIAFGAIGIDREA